MTNLKKDHTSIIYQNNVFLWFTSPSEEVFFKHAYNGVKHSVKLWLSSRYLDQQKRPQPPKEPYKRFLQQRLVLVVSYLIERQKNITEGQQTMMTIFEIRV